ncbi:MAG: hypothetical protein QOF76_5467 [Solirubrobacteraceae bacterium]|jgi:hypothetical protein|nr:hypothetical protein [Solirubrobacteraceae bacterium]
MSRKLLVLPLVVIPFKGCEKFIQADGAEKTIRNFVATNTQAEARNVECPSGVKATVGNTFDCHFDGPDGKYVAHMKVRSVDGARVLFDILTERDG